MESLRPYFWIIVLIVIIVISLLIIMIFIIINVCISKKAALYHTQTKINDYNDTKFTNQENHVYQRNLTQNEKPPLPPRDQFQSMDSVTQGYEHVEPLQDYVVVEGSTAAEPKMPFTPQYTTVQTKKQDTVVDDEDYDDVEMPESCDSEDYDDVG